MLGIILSSDAPAGSSDAPAGPKANFYIPTLGFSRAEPEAKIRSSHVFLRDWTLLRQFGRKAEYVDGSYNGVTFVVESLARLAEELSAFLAALSGILEKVLVIVPMVEDLRYWAVLRDSSVGIILRAGPVASSYLDRYKVLLYSGVLAVSRCPEVVYLSTKSTRPDILVHEQDVTELLLKFLDSAARSELPPCSDMLIDPLQPLTQNLGLEVYETFEKDSVKYAQYEFAIDLAIQDLRLGQKKLKILVVGPGRGPLLKLVMQFASEDDTVVAVERNPKCKDTLLALAEQWSGRVELLFQDARDLADMELYDLVVSELLGSFGCNEAAPEILVGFSSALTIPQDYRSWVQPIYTDVLKGDEARPYLASLNSYYSVGEPQLVFEFDDDKRLNRCTSLSFSGDELDRANALLGFFDATLYGPYRIGILPSMPTTDYCASWFPLLMPIGVQHYPISVTIERKSTDQRLWYEWTVAERVYNGDGHNYSISTK